MVETIGFPVTANQSSAGDYLPIDSDTLAGCTVKNSSAYAVEYSTGGAWTTIAAGGRATINTGAIATTSLRFRKKTGDSIPVVLSVAVTHPGTTPAQLATDAGGNVSGLVGPGGAVVSRLSMLGGHVWVAGDSTAMFAQEAPSADINAADAQCALTHLNSMLGGTLLQVGNSAVSGVDTGHVVSTQIPAIKSAISGGEKVDWIFLQITANDFYHSSYLRTADYVKANILRILRDLSDVNIPVVMVNGFPRGPATVGANTYSSGQQVEQLKFVDWCNTALPAMFPQHVIVDSYSIGSDASRQPLAGYLYDDLHPATRYARLIAKAIKPRIGAINPAIYPRVLSASDVAGGAASKNILAGSALGGTLGQTTLLSGWTEAVKTNCTVTYLVKANTYGGAGNMLECVVTFSAAGQLVLQLTEAFTANSRITTGELFWPSAIVDAVESTTGVLKDAYVRGSTTDGTTPKYSFGNWHRTPDVTAGGYYDNIIGEVQIGCPKAALTGVNGCTFQMSVRSTGAGTVTLRFAEPAIFKR